jgi:hypothetical protein
VTYSTNPVRDADRYLTAADTYLEDRANAEKLMADEFLAATRAGRMDAPALFAARTADHVAPKKADGSRYQRYQVISEVMTESLDYGDGPKMADLMDLLCRVAKGEVQTAAARELLNRMAASFAKYNADVS